MIECIIVDDHCDIVPFIHALYRSKKLSFSHPPPNMLHFDSHSDLSLPPSPTLDWLDKEALYRLLHSPGGISEFLIPLLYMRLLASLTWIHPPWTNHSHNCSKGPIRMKVGDSKIDNLAKSSWIHQDYIDDGSISLEENMIPSTTRDILVSVHDSSDVIKEDDNIVEDDWILDICLDYFIVSNPFLVDLRCSLGRDGFNESEIDSCIDILLFIISSFSFRQQTRTLSSSLTPDEILKLRHDTLLEWKRFHSIIVDDDDNSSICCNDQDIWMEYLTFQVRMSSSTRESLGADPLILLLPHHLSSPEEIDRQMERLKEICERRKNPPVAVTIARSLDDGYVPRRSVV